MIGTVLGKVLAIASGALIVFLPAAGLAGPARADFRVETFEAGAANEVGGLETQAGAHPYSASTSFSFTTALMDTALGPDTIEYPTEHIKTTVVDLPAGFVGDPTAIPSCSRVDLTLNGLGRCPIDSQVGVITLKLSNGIFGPPRDYTTGVYNVTPEDGEIADFAFVANSVPVHIRLAVAPDSGYRVRATIENISTALPVASSKLTLWGVPADPSHDPQRGPGFRCDGSDGSDPSLCDPTGGFASNAVRRPLLTNPTYCGPPVTTSLWVDTWEHPGVRTSATASSPGATGCERLAFDPTMTVRPDTTQAASPTGLDVDLAIPQDGLKAPGGVGAAHLRTVTVTLPEGMSVNPSSADGLQACGDAALGLGTGGPVTCPAASKIGTARATTPLLAETLTGAIYLRPQASNDPESGDMFRIALVLENAARGLSVRLPGSITADTRTGRLVATFKDNPQVPVSDIDLRFKSGARAPLATPSTCGAKTVEAQLTSWSGQTVDQPTTSTIDCAPGLGGFAPSLDAGLVRPQAGGSSPFTLTLSRSEGQQEISGLTVSLPPGVLGDVGSVPQCLEGQAAAGRCEVASRIGTTTVFAGAGPAPLHLPQAGKAPTAVYLAGPYKGAPFSLSIVVPAQAGPFDLGTVVVRAALFIDPVDAHVTVISDPIPTIVAGVPVRIQRINVTIDRPGFIVSPTNCTPTQVGAHVTSVQGAVADAASRFQVGDCAALALNPKLDLSLSGKGQTTDGKHPAVSATLTQPAGQANLKKVRVALPLSLALDPDNANGLCEFVDGSKVEPTCPKASIVGRASAVTPILDEPLSGPVYFVKNVRKDAKSGREIRTLPKLVIPLVGQNGVKLTLTGTSDVVDDQLVTTFDNVPDAPVSSFKLDIIGGKGGILTVSGADICKATQVADRQIDGQNGKAADADVFIQTPSCPLKVISKKVGKTSVAVKVGGLGAGKVAVTGRGIKKTTKTISKSTVATITAKRTKGKPGKVTVSFDPTGPAKAHKTTK